MQYNININQKAAIDSGAKIDLVDAAILDYLLKFSHSPNVAKKRIGRKIFYWFSYSNMEENLPLLRMNCRGFARRIKALRDKGFLEAHPKNAKFTKTYLHLTELAFSLQFQTAKPADKPIQQIGRGKQTPTTNLHGTPTTELYGTPTTKLYANINTSEHSTSNIESSDYAFFLSQWNINANRVLDDRILKACLSPEDWAAIRAHLPDFLKQNEGFAGTPLTYIEKMKWINSPNKPPAKPKSEMTYAELSELRHKKR